MTGKAAGKSMKVFKTLFQNDHLPHLVPGRLDDHDEVNGVAHEDAVSIMAIPGNPVVPHVFILVE